MQEIRSLVKDGQEGKLDYGRALFLGLGFFIITATWGLYNAYVPIFLKRFLASETFIGLIMTFDNIAAISLQPYFGVLSDNTKTRFGSRLPFLLLGIPIAAVFFSLIPLASSFSTLLLVLIVMNLAMSIFRSPTIALMPDLTPTHLRSKANGVINFMGGIGAVLTYALGSYLYDVNPLLPFLGLGILLVLILLLFLWRIKEPARPETTERINVFKIIKKIMGEDNKRVLFILLAIFAWFFGYSGVETFFTLYGKEFLGIKESAAAFSLSFFSLTFVIFAIPSGLLATRFGRRKTILTGIAGLIMVFAVLFFLRDILMIRIVMLIGGLFWALININSYPLVVDEAGSQIGAYTGVYYFFSTLPAILSPIITGRLIEVLGYQVLFLVSIVSFILAFYFIFQIKEQTNFKTGQVPIKE